MWKWNDKIFSPCTKIHSMDQDFKQMTEICIFESVFNEFMNRWENLYNMYSASYLAHIPDIGTSWIGLKYSSEYKKFRWVDSRFVNVSYLAQFPYAILYYV